MIIVLGHLCLDIFPAIPAAPEPFAQRLRPGVLLDVGAATFSTGGAVANTGLALHRLGVPVRLIAKVGADPFANVIRGLLSALGEGLGRHLLEAPDAPTSYTVVLDPPGGDRMFLHCTGANDTFTADEMLAQDLGGARLAHFGYPPLMRQMYADNGNQLVKLFAGLRGRGLATSLDMALPDPDSAAGKAPWQRILPATLPLVDVFTPSLDEIVFMLDPARGMELRKKIAQGVPLGGLSNNEIRAIVRDLLAMGCGAVLLKLGKEGAYARVGGQTGGTGFQPVSGACARQGGAGFLSNCQPGEECAMPCFQEAVFAGATGAGDATIAGFLCGLTRGMTLRESLRLAVAAGGASVEKPDATSGIPTLEKLLGRINAGWPLMASRFV